MCSMTNGNCLPPAHQPSGIMPAQRPACPPETAAPRRRPAGARPDGSAEQPAPVQVERQASGRAGTTEQERSRQAAARAAPAPPSHITSRQPRPADQPRPAGDRAADPIQPSPSARSDPVRESRGGEEGEGERGAARPSVQISRPGHNMPNTPPNRPGQTVPERSSHSDTREQPEPPDVLRVNSAFGENAEPATPQPPKSDGRQPHPAAVAPPDRGSLDISATPAHLR